MMGRGRSGRAAFLQSLNSRKISDVYVFGCECVCVCACGHVRVCLCVWKYESAKEWGVCECVCVCTECVKRQP